VAPPGERRLRHEDGPRSAPCDYARRYGTLEFAPGETIRTILVPVVGDRAVEGDEELAVLLGNPEGAVLGRDAASVRILDDDGESNRPPSPHRDRAPPDGATGVASPALSWLSADPDPGDELRHDVFLGTAFTTSGQQWLPVCAEGAAPGPRWAAVAGLDEANDRLVVYGGETPDGPAESDLLVLENASGAGGAPAWLRVPVAGGPGPLAWAGGAFDPAGNRLVVFGGCGPGCAAPSGETWILEGANGLQGSPEWRRLSASGPPARSGAATAYDPAGDRLFVFGGSTGSSVEGDLWVLEGALRSGAPAWRSLAVAGAVPAARRDAGLVWDSRTERLLLFGGRTSEGEAFGDLHALALSGGLPAWEELDPAGAGPAPRFAVALAYDAASQRLLVYGGSTAAAEGVHYVFSDAWLLTGAGAGERPEWVRVEPGGHGPAGRYAPVAALSPGASRLIVAGGANDKLAFPPDDLWLLDGATGRLPLVSAGQAEPSLLATEASTGEVLYWRIVTRDARGAWRGSPAWRFTTNRAPSVDAGPDLLLVGAPAAGALAGTVEDDGLPAGSTVEAAWEAVSGPGAVLFDDPASAATTARFDAPGLYVLRLTATDGQASASDEVAVEVRPANRAPLVDAGEDIVLETLASPAFLHGTVSDDGLPSGALEVLWSVVSGPGDVRFADPSSATTTASFSAPGDYVLRLAASDGELAAHDEVAVAVGSAPDLEAVRVDLAAWAVDPRTLFVSGELRATVANRSDLPVAVPFDVTFFEDRDGDGRLDPAVDAVLAVTTLDGLPGGASATAAAPAEGSVLFPESAVLVFVDSGEVVAELDESNNVASSASPCPADPPPAASFATTLEWAWTGSTVEPTAVNVMMTPVVADLDRDGVPEVVFTSFATSTSRGVLRAVRGTDGAEVFSVADLDSRPSLGGQLAVGNLDDDPELEIVAVAFGGGSLIAFEHDGTVKWRATIARDGSWGGPALADLDGDGTPEIVIGRQVFGADGSLRWTGTGGTGGQGGTGPLSLVADLDLDGVPEVVAGNTAYRASGAVYWVAEGLPDGFNAVGNFDDDPYPEVVLVSGGKVWLLEHTGEVKWGPVAIGSGIGGPPTVADFDGDGAPEIGVAGSNRYSVLETDGTLKWAAVVQDISSNRTGSTVFDFEGDGSAEVVYQDEHDLWVFRGTDGTVLLRIPSRSATAYENPVVADVDLDGRADIVTIVNGSNPPRPPGVHVFSGDWVPTRPIWNQHTYHVTNVEDDGSVPRRETPGWLTFNSYRQNQMKPACVGLRPDLTASFARVAAAGEELELLARLANPGGAAVGPGVPVAFYDGDPRLGGRLLGVASSAAALGPGRFEDVAVRVPATATFLPLWVSADDAGGLVGRVVELDESNNLHDSGRYRGAAVNLPPVVSAGPDAVVFLPDTVSLAGTASDDGLPVGALVVSWSRVSGPGPVAFEDPAAPATLATFTEPGTYVLRLRASDLDLVATDDVTVEVRPARPDLRPTGLSLEGYAVDGQSLLAGGALAATVANHGDAAAGPFDVAFFEDRDGSGRFEPGSDLLLGLARVSGLGAGESRAVSAPAAGEVSFRGSPVHVLVDASDAVEEKDETNNFLRSGPATADLLASRVRAERPDGGLVLSARIGNAGREGVPGGIGVSFYDGDPSAGGVLLGTALTTGALEGGAFEDVAIAVPAETRARPLFVVADDDGGLQGRIAEADETNNAWDSRLFVSPEPNAPPVVWAGPDQRLPHPQATTTLEGSAEDDGLPLDRLSVTWSLVSGPAPAAFAEASSAVTAVELPGPGTYVLRLTASDEELAASDDAVVVVEPENRAPVVDAGPDRVVSGLADTLAGSVTDDGLPFGAPLSVLWTQVEGPAAAELLAPAAAATTVRFAAPGAYAFRLTASDTALSASDEVRLAVAFVNAPPAVDAGPDKTTALPDGAVLLEGAAEDDGLPLGSSLSVRWSLVSGPAPVAIETPTAAQTTARFTDPGTYVLRLRATDGALHAEDRVSVAVAGTAPAGAPPTAVLRSPGPGQRLALPEDVIGTAASESLASWQLERRLQGDLEWTRFASGADAVEDGVLGRLDPTLLLNGIHEVRLTVTDTAGRIARASAPVVVREQAKVGHFTVSFVDLEVAVAGLPVRVSRTYDSRDARRGEFGHGWRLELANVRVQPAATLGLAWYGSVSPGAFGSYCLQPTAPPLVALTFPDGRVQEFEMRLTPSCQAFVPIQTARVTFAPVGPTLGRLELPSGGDVEVVGSWPGPMQLFGAGYSLFSPASYRYVSPDGQVFVVDRAAGLVSLTDRSGNVLTMTPAGITSSHPEVAGSAIGVAFTRDAQGRITRVTDPDGRSLVYDYDAEGDLVAVTDREGETTRFTYEEDLPHQLRDILDPLGRRPIRNEYDPDGRLVAHEDAFGNRILYQHDLLGRQEVVTDRTGAQRVLEYDERGNVVRETDARGRVVVRTFDLRNNRLSETEAYDPASPPDPLPTTTWTYDPEDNLLTTTDPLGNTTAYTYNATRQVLTTTDAGGGTTTNAYDARGNLVSTTDPLGNATSYTYDTRGNVLTQAGTVGGETLLTRYQYDAHGRLVRETDPLGHETSYTYDRSGNRLSHTTTRTTPAGTETLLTRYEHDASGRLVGTIDPDGTSTRTAYDALGRQVETWDKLGRRTAYEYDVMGRLVKTSYPDGTFEEHGYDPEGRRTSSTDRAGRTSRYEYDPLGRLVRTIHPDGASTASTYDEAGRLVASIDVRGHATAYEYDAAGRRTAVVDPLGQRTTFTYDPGGNQTRVTDPRGHTVTYEYDALNRRTRTLFPSADGTAPPTVTETGYDALGRRVSETDPAGRTTRFEYDALGRLTAVVDALGQRTSYGYDEQGNRTSQTDASGRTTSFEYDALGRETRRTLPAVTDPAGGPAVPAFETKTYDAAGNLTSHTDFMGRVTTYAYDPDTDRLASRTYPNPDENVAFTYTPTGRRKTATDSRGTTSYAYDLRDRLVSLTYPDGRSLGYDYDPQGNRTKLTATLAALSLVTTQTFDPLARLATVTDPAGRVYSHGYDPNGNRASLAHPNGVLTHYTYDTLNRLTNLATTHAPSGRHVQAYAFTLGPAGNRTRIVESAGLPQQRTLDYGYDALYRLTGETVTESLGLVYAKAFGYDPVGNRLTQATTIGPAGSPGPHLQPGTIGYAYDERDRLRAEQLDATPATAYGWDDNGNLTTKDAEATYTWDHENRLVRVETTDGTIVEHAYDADGNRVRTKVTPPTGPPTITDFLVDTSGPLSHVVAETDGSLPPGAPGSLKAYYVRGDDLLAVMRPLVTAPAAATPADWQTRYYHADGLGSIRRLTDEAANITDGYTYSAFGELLAHTGSDPQPYAFTGEPLDPNSGWQYHRARWMDPRTGRFAGMDPFDGVTSDPPSLHRYLYAHAGPVDAFDPTGQMTLAQGLSVASMVARIATISIVSYQVVNIVRLTATEEITVEDAMYQLAEIGRDQAIAYVGGHLLNGVVKFGLVPASKIPQLLSLVHRNRLKGKFAESLWAAGNGVTKNRGRLGGRIPDFVRGKVWDELKYYEGKSVMYLTKQLRDMTAYAGRHGIQFNLHAIPGANVSADLAAAVARTGGSVIYDLPRLQAQAFTMAAAAADDFVDAEDFWP
jgi:RHS repeat-associated protein